MGDLLSLHAGFLIVYLLALIAVGALKARRIKTQEDFSLAGRGLPTFVLVGTLLATWIGTGSIFGNAEETYTQGLAGFLLPVAGAAGIVALFVLAPRIRRFGQVTIQDILEARFGVAARVIGTLTLVLAYVIIVSYQYRAGAAVLAYMAPGLDGAAGVFVVAAFVILYTALAGLFSVAYTDVANGALMVLGLGLAIPILLSQAGGFGAAVDALQPAQQDPFGVYGPVALLSILLPAFLLLLGDANMVQRFFAARDERSAQRSAGWMLFGVLALEAAIILVAVLGAALVAQGAIEPPKREGHIIVHLAFEALPPWLGACLAATVVAVVVSTADSYLLSPATAVVRDAWQRFLRPDAGDAELVRAGRLVVIALGLVALGLACRADRFFHVALFAYTLYGAAITPVLMAAWFWPRATRAGATASMATGLLVALAWKAVATLGAETAAGRWIDGSGVDAVIPAVGASVLVLIVVSLAGPPPDPAQLRAFYSPGGDSK
jgi:SSS family solute:Na+ symporter/sodium/proline symporter